MGVKSDSRDCYVKSKIENKNKSVQFQELYCTQITIVNFCSAFVIRVFVDEIVYLIKIVLMIIHGYVTPSKEKKSIDNLTNSIDSPDGDQTL